MAQAFARFGSEVVLVASEHGILPRGDSDASKIVREALGRDGVALRGHGRELTVSRADGAKIRLCVDTSGNAYAENVDKLLIGTGRAPNVEGSDSKPPGSSFPKGRKSERPSQTTNPRIFAAVTSVRGINSRTPPTSWRTHCHSECLVFRSCRK
jgi:pyruvate/2-oxoglutarate dehydrogenase complex dihydrolipoamide dehydrogenase (E3) component